MRHVLKKIKEVIVVEGKRDTAAVRRAVAADTLETGGSAVGSDLIRAIRRAQDRRGVIILTDPDGAGERIVVVHAPGRRMPEPGCAAQPTAFSGPRAAATDDPASIQGRRFRSITSGQA